MSKPKSELKRTGLFLTLFLWCILAVAFGGDPAAYAAGGGDGTGGGGGPVIPLTMDWSYPANGATGVSVTPIIQCKYSHNVANFDVKARNAKLFSLIELRGKAVPITVYMADAQLEFTKRQYIYLIPVRPLKNDTTYIVTAQIGVQAKNGMATDRVQTFRFTTGRKTVALATATNDAGSTGTANDSGTVTAQAASGQKVAAAPTTAQTQGTQVEAKQSKQAGNQEKQQGQTASGAKQKGNSNGPGRWLFWLVISLFVAASFAAKLIAGKQKIKSTAIWSKN